jgi:multisubunit Na+/H+ antiporter MnhB subunit
MQPPPHAELVRVPARQRRQLATLLSPVATVLLVAGILLAWRAGSPGGHLGGIVLALLALLLLGIGYGLLRSIRIQARERRLDEAILTTAGACGGHCDGGREPGACAATDCAVRALPRS